MTEESSTPWARESQLLIEAQARYLASLDAIRDIADFVAESTPILESKDKNRAAAAALTDLGKSFQEFQKANPDYVRLEMTISPAGREGELKSDDHLDTSAEEVKEDIGEELSQWARSALEKFGKAFPRDFDFQNFRDMKAISRSPRRTDLLLSSLLTAAVSDFEVLFAAAVRCFYWLRPEALRSPDAEIPWSEIEQYNSLDELKTHYIDQRVSKLMWQGFDDWMKWLSQQLKVKFDEIALDPAGTAEVFQRRHIILHNGGIVSPQYLSKLSGMQNPPVIGAKLRVDQKYLSESIERLAVLGASLVYRILSKLCPGQLEHHFIDSEILQLIFDFLKDERWPTAERIAELALPHITHEYERLAVRVNKWIAMKALNGIDSIRADVTNWDVSALGGIFRLARLALLGEESAIDVAREMLSNGELNMEDLKSWPLLRDINESVIASAPGKDSPQSPDDNPN